MKNKQINKFLLMFFISFTLLFSISYAGFGSTGRSIWKVAASKATTDVDHQITENYTMYDIYGICKDYLAGNMSENVYKAMCSDLESNGFAFVYCQTDSLCPLVVYPYETVDIGYAESKKTIYTDGKTAESSYVYVRSGSGNPGYQGKWVTNNASSTYACYYEDSYGFVPSLYTHDIKALTISSNKLYWDGESYFYKAETPTPEVPVLSDAEFSAMLDAVTTSELFYQHIPSDYRNNFYVQYDAETDKYLFYFYPSSYMVRGLLRNENNYHVLCGKDFSWWDKVVDFLNKTFDIESENLNYEMIYVQALDDGTYSCWYRSKLMSSVDETLFNLETSPIVYSSVQIPFYGKHGGGGINIDTGDKTLATEPEYVINDEVYGESSIVYNPNPIETISGEQDFWDKVVNRLASIVSYVKDIPTNIVNRLHSMNGFTAIMTIVSPLAALIITIIKVLGSSISLISRATTFIYKLPIIEASRTLFDADVATTEGISFVGNNWGIKFLDGLDMVRNFSWNGLNLWSLFTTFVAAMFAIQVIKYIRKHYHY